VAVAGQAAVCTERLQGAHNLPPAADYWSLLFTLLKSGLKNLYSLQHIIWYKTSYQVLYAEDAFNIHIAVTYRLDENRLHLN